MNKSISCYTCEELDTLCMTHDSRLPAWGPYSKVAAGIAHVFDQSRGTAFNLSVFPVIYRGRSQLPTEMIQSNFHPWYASGDLSFYTYRFELEWKDQVYSDVTYIRMDDDRVLVEVDAHNETDLPQQIGIHYLSSMQFPKSGSDFAEWVRPECDTEAVVVDGVHYSRLVPAEPHYRDRLVYDGKYLCEINEPGMVRGRGLGDRFGRTAGDFVEYILDRPDGRDVKLMIRAKGHGRFTLGGCAESELVIDSDEFTVYTVCPTDFERTIRLALTCVEGCGVVIDTVAAAQTPVRFVPDRPYFIPVVEEGQNRLTLTYREDCAYGIAWAGDAHMTRQIFDSDWEHMIKYNVMNHVSPELHGDHKAHYTDLYARPFFLEPHSSEKMYAMVCTNPTLEKFEAWEAFDPIAYAEEVRAKQPVDKEDPYAFSQRLMRATILTNVVFPVYVQGQYIRHFTPGKWWDSLYTWDSGFIALGLTELDEHRALDTLNCYLTEVGNPHAAFIHHGSPVPVQAYVYKALWDKCLSRDYLLSFYPRMRQYYEYLMGRGYASATRLLKSGLINTFAYFYNSGGWDDYPPQVAVRGNKMADRTCPVVSTIHAIVFARILRQVSVMLGLGDEAGYDSDIQELADSLQTYSWDEEAGYFSYVVHDAEGNPIGFLQDENGVNYNMGLDGALAILAGICTSKQEERLADSIMDPEKMWTRCGISTVDKSAPYYRVDGYWNGAVWMPHQWFAFLGMLALGRSEDAVKIARTALEVWKRETDTTYNCYEHFVLTSGRGGGWHHFSGLSTPVVLWYHSMWVPGTITTPPATFVVSREFCEDHTYARIAVTAASSLRGESSILVTMAPGKYRVMVNAVLQDCPVYDNAVAVNIKDGQDSVVEILLD